MDAIETRIAGLILTKLRLRIPDLSHDDFTRPIGELDLDSLDNLELVHLLERELRVKADLEETAAFAQLHDFVPYFATLASSG